MVRAQSNVPRPIDATPDWQQAASASGAVTFPATNASPPRDAGTPVTDAPENADQRLRRLLIGTWQDEYQGKRTMTVREDGTATMVVELSGWKATLLASRLQFEMTWTIEQRRLKKHTTGGEPAAPVALILETFGDSVDEPILELTQDRLLLLDRDGTTKYDWRRAR
jgi:hypothetical protein